MESALEKTSSPSARQIAEQHVLVVDDSRPMQIFTQRMLEIIGATVECADDGEAALRLAGQGIFDLMLIDIEMPGIDGCDVARLLRATGNKAPIVAVTAHSEPEEHNRCLASGFDACLTKPFSKDKLLSILPPLITTAAERGFSAPSQRPGR